MVGGTQLGADGGELESVATSWETRVPSAQGGLRGQLRAGFGYRACADPQLRIPWQPCIKWLRRRVVPTLPHEARGRP